MAVKGSCVASVLFLFDDAAFAFEFGDEFGRGGEDGAVFGGEEFLAAFEDVIAELRFVGEVDDHFSNSYRIRGGALWDLTGASFRDIDRVARQCRGVRRKALEPGDQSGRGGRRP